MNSYDPDCYGDLIRGMSQGNLTPKLSRMAEVTIEEVGGDLSAGVKTRCLSDIDFRPPIYRIVKPDVGTATDTDQNGDHIVKLESFCRIGDVCNSLWDVFKLRGLFALKSTYCQTANGTGNYIKVHQTFLFSVTQNNCVPYVQFVCKARCAKHQGSWFHKGDIITVVVRHKNMPKLPDPQIISVQPRLEQTYVPMLPKQKLQIVTDQSRVNLEWNNDSASPLFYHGIESVDCGPHVRCDLFECIAVPRVQELFFVNSRYDGTCKVICIPAFSCENYPVLIDPVKTCMVYASGIEGFLLRSHKHMQLIVENNCPLRPVYTADRFNCCETRVQITKAQPFFVLERAKQSWIAKNPAF